MLLCRMATVLSNGNEALDILQGAVDVMLVVNMPQMGGIELISRVRRTIKH